MALAPELANRLPPLLQSGAFQRRLVLFLLPYFAAVTNDFDVAREEVLETLATYGARTRSELINAARIIAFSFSALSMLAEAKETEMPPGLKLRFGGCANGLNRSCRQDEQMLARRLACDLPDTANAAAEPVNDVGDVDFEAALRQAEDRIATYRNRLSGVRPATSPQPPPASGQPRLSRGAAMMDALAGTTIPLQPAPAS
jgi:hypothetical protein